MTVRDQPYDVIVAGLGAMGSASAYALTRSQTRSHRVLGIDRFSPPHALGSSHGRTRIIREAYFEHPAYVPIVRRAFDLWRELEQAVGRTLYTRTRGITLGAEDGMLVRGARASAERFGVPHGVLSAAEVTRNFPALRPLDSMVGVVEDRAGVLFPEHCIAAMLEVAERAGAELRREETVVSWEASDDGVVVRTTAGDYRAARLVITGGAWMPRLVPELAGTLAVERQPIHWFVPDSHAEDYSAARCPVTLWEYAPDRTFYTLPDFGDGVKAAVHYEGRAVDPDQVDRRTSPEEVTRVAELLRRFMPNANATLRESQVCLYTNTPDLHFIIDRHPAHADRVVVVSACSGHGFKFATAIGEIVADLVADVKPRFDLDMFRMTRFQTRASKGVRVV
jgi:sarcosine oxidase